VPQNFGLISPTITRAAARVMVGVFFQIYYYLELRNFTFRLSLRGGAKRRRGNLREDGIASLHFVPLAMTEGVSFRNSKLFGLRILTFNTYSGFEYEIPAIERKNLLSAPIQVSSNNLLALRAIYFHTPSIPPLNREILVYANVKTTCRNPGF